MEYGKNTHDIQDDYAWAAKPQTIVKQEKKLDELIDTMEALHDIIQDISYLVDILKNANVPVDSPLGALIRLLLDRVKEIDEKREAIGIDEITTKKWIEIETVRRVLRLNAKSVDVLKRKVNVLEAEARGSHELYEKLESENNRLRERQQVKHLNELFSTKKQEKNRTQEEKNKQGLHMAKEILKQAGIEKNWDLIPFELNKEYTWDGFIEWDDENIPVPVDCKFKVTEVEKDPRTIGGVMCHVTYTKGPYKEQSVKIPLEDMPPTVEKRGD